MFGAGPWHPQNRLLKHAWRLEFAGFGENNGDVCVASLGVLSSKAFGDYMLFAARSFG
jgi:hypothetical protein